MHHHRIALAIGEKHVADRQNAAAPSRLTASPRRPYLRLRALALGLGAVAVIAPAGALAQPAHDADPPANTRVDTVHRHDHPTATRPSITFTNPLGRSRGPGAGAGLL
jgi:hypothetical protein